MNEQIKQTKRSVNDYIDALYIQTISAFDRVGIDKDLTQNHIEDYLKRRGYTSHMMGGKPTMIKGFTCVYIGDGYVELWHDVKGSKSTFISNSLFTGLPISLKYMESI